MKTHALLLSVVGLFPISKAAAQIPNGGFENWTSVDGHLEPDDWMTSNSTTEPFGVITCEQGAPGEAGNYYAKITSHIIVVQGVSALVLGYLISGDPATQTPGFPYSERPEALNGSIQYDMQGSDQGNVTVSLVLNNVAIAGGILELNGSQNGWENFSIPILYEDETSYPDAAIVTVASSGSPGVEGSTVSVDNLSFGPLSANAGIQEVQAAVGLRVYPTLTSDLLNVEADQPLAQVDILDMTGRSLMHQGVNAENITLNVSDLNKGRYLVQVHLADGRRLVRSFVKQ